MTAQQTAIEDSAPYGLTRSQELIWLGQQLLPDMPLYNMVFTFRFESPVHFQQFSRAFQHAVDNNDGMRSVFEASKAGAVQRIAGRLDYSFRQIDFSQDAQPERSAVRWIAQRKLRKLNLAVCCFDSALLRLNESSFIWYLNQHHLITDVWSTSLFYQSVLQAYHALLDNQSIPACRRPSILEFHEYEASCRRQEKARKMPRGQNERAVKPCLYGVDFMPGSGRSRRLCHLLSEDQDKCIESLMQHRSVATFSPQLTRFNIFLTVLCAYLSRTTNLSHVTIGVPVHNRTQLRHQQTVGLFIELFPVSVDLDERLSFIELYQAVALKTQTLLQNAGPGRSQVESARRYNIILNYINAKIDHAGAGLADVEWVHCDYSDPAHFLRVHVCRFTDSKPAELIFDVAEHLHNQCARPDIASHFVRLLEAFTGNPEKKISCANIGSDHEKQLLLHHFNKASNRLNKSEHSSVLDLFRRSVANCAAQPAISDGKQICSYSGLDMLSDTLALELISRGIGDGDLVAIYAQRSTELIVAILAVLKSGAAFIPLADNMPQKRITYILEQSRSALLISHRPLTENLQGCVVPQLAVELDKLHKAAAHNKTDLPGGRSAQLAYVIYTSGSTGQPKGVMISHQSLHDYVHWAIQHYTENQALRFPLYSNIGFDLTLTSIFVPLCSGGSIKIYRPQAAAVDTCILDVFQDNQVDIVKLTPAHLAPVLKLPLADCKVKSLILGGEDLKASLAREFIERLKQRVKIFNEYGPTEATVGCMIHEYDSARDDRFSASVPIGVPAEHARIYLLDDGLNPVPAGVTGEIYIAGSGLARGYLNSPGLTHRAFKRDPFFPDQMMYKTGDLARMLPNERLVYLSRKDDQFKFHGIRIEKAEIEQALIRHSLIRDCHVTKHVPRMEQSGKLIYCSRCGIASNYPDIKFDHNDVCNICLDFEQYRDMADQYFGSMAQLHDIISNMARRKTGRYDCMMLYSGGKDSTYALYQLSEMGFSVYAMTLDNGFISSAAKSNIRRTVEALGIDHVFAQTGDMNDIFVDSLKRHCSVCYGCFKTIYTLAMKIARDKGISCIVTGLSRGQFFETRLTKESFLRHNFDPQKIDEEVLKARKTYHHVNDIVTQRLANGLFDDDRIFTQIEFVDFYRYCDVSLTQIYDFLENHVPWIRPEDTGRSTNCTINDTGIYFHKTRQGFHNYALPYSWDVRLGLKTREQALDELNDEIDTGQVAGNLEKIGFDQGLQALEPDQEALVAYYVSDNEIPVRQLRDFLLSYLPASIMPNYFVHLQELPLTENAKIDHAALPDPLAQLREIDHEITRPSTTQEKALVAIFSQIFRNKEIGVQDNYFDLGGDSIKAIQISASASQIGITIKPAQLFDYQTIAELARVVEKQVSVSAAQHSISGEAPLTPVQRWFFTQPQRSLNRFSHSVVIKLYNQFSTGQIQAAINKLIDHHDVLRHRFTDDEHGWRQHLTPMNPEITVDCYECTSAARQQQIEQIEAILNAGLDIESGRLLNCAKLVTSDDGSIRIVIVIHHLAVDAVSWGIFLEDLDVLLKQINHNQTLLLPFKTSAYLDWAKAVAEYASSVYHADHDFAPDDFHPVAVPGPDQSPTTPDSIGSVELQIESAAIRPLQGRKINNRIVGLQEWVLAALAITMSEYCGRQAICINVESHGREDINDNINVTRTLGWFTSVNSIYIDLAGVSGAEQLIEQIYQRNESAFNQFISKSLASDRYIAPQQNSGVLFNFLGAHTDHYYQNFTICRRLKLLRCESSIMQHGFEINVYEAADGLRIEWLYDRNRHGIDSIRRLLENLRQALANIVSQLDRIEDSRPTYSLPDLDENELAAITSQLK